MASSGSSSLLTRNRTARLAANSTKQAPTGRSLVVPPTASGSAGQGQPAASATHLSNLEIFLANLRILDLDLLPDWPDISPQTFAGNVASQGQKKRVQCVEWALYHLFVLWDQDEARKLQAFFPPTDQVQSLNLRATLLRCLEQAKKNGVLGRDTVIRKTMLDECRGDRLEEVLAAFSFAVVRRAVGDDADASGQHPALAQTLALENRGYTGERTELAVLTLAHQASLSRALREKKATRALFNDFAELLDVKQRSITRRREQIKGMDAQSSTQGVSDDEKLDVWRLVRNNWAGNERWMETLLYGDVNARRDGLLTTPFDKVWRRVQAGRLSELEDHGTGLLEQLDGRVKFQRERLEKWEAFRKRMFAEGRKRETASHAPRKEERKGIDLRFDAHRSLHLGRTSPRKARTTKPTPLNAEYSELLASFEKDMKAAGKPTTKPITELIPRRRVDMTRLSAEGPSEEVISELSELEEEMMKPPVTKEEGDRLSRLKTKHRPLVDKRAPDEGPSHRRASVSKPDPEQPSRQEPSVKQHSRSYSKQKHRSPSVSPTRPAKPLQNKNRSPTRDLIARQSLQVKSPELEEPPVSPTQAQADEILASMNTTSPSPTKQPKPRHTLSLAERTRLTMGRKSSKPVSSDDEEEALPLHRSPSKPPPPIIKEDDSATGEYEDLVARTRKSMAGFEAARQKAQLERRRSQRKSKMVVRREGSHFPKVHEGDETMDASLIAEELMEGDHNYEDVFMSRPKIKTSPAPSPKKELEE